MSKYLANKKKKQIFNGVIPRYKSKILWTNPNPTAAYVTGTVELLSDDYDFLEWFFNDTSSIRIMKGTGVDVTTAGGSGGYMLITCYRRISRNNDISFDISQCTKYAVSNSVTYEFMNNSMIPIMVIGHKLPR